jgi:hypothetical protein
MKDDQLFEVMTSIVEAERNPMITEVAFLLNAGYADYRNIFGKNKNNTAQKYYLTEKGMNKYLELQINIKEL